LVLLQLGYNADQAIKRVRTFRTNALTNHHFVQVIHSAAR
jgi:hypothetical protein